MIPIKHQIFYFPEASARLDTLCELICETSIDSSYFYGLAHICNSIEKLIMFNSALKDNNGIIKLIEVQRNLKYFEWKDDFLNYDMYFNDDDPYEEIFLALAKKADTLNYFITGFQNIDDYDHTILQCVLSRLRKLKTLQIGSLYDDEEELKMLVYRDLEVLKIDDILYFICKYMFPVNGRATFGLAAN